LAVNVRVRRASDDLSGVKSASELYAALNSLLDTDEFDCAILEVNENEPTFESYPTRYRHLTNGRATWVWKRNGAEFDKVISSDQCWMLRLPLVAESGQTLGSITFYRKLVDETPTIDIGYLCGTFQRELSAALARVMCEKVKG
jgi:hypothetical protein